MFSEMMMRLLLTMTLLVVSACNLSTSPPETPGPIPTTTPVTIDARGTPDPSPVPGSGECTPRTDWALFTVPEGMTLSNLAFLGGTTIEELMAANCLENADTIFAGQDLRVPPNFPPTPVPGLGNAPEARVGISPYERFDGGWYELQPGATVTLVWEPPLPADVTQIEYYAIASGAADPTLIVVDASGGDNIGVSWQVPAQFAGQIMAVAYRGEAVYAQAEAINVFTSFS